MPRLPTIPFALLALPLAACTTWPDAGYAPAPVAPIATPSTAATAWPTDPFIVTAPGPSGALTPYHVMPTPGGGAVVQPGVLPPLNRSRGYSMPPLQGAGVLPPLNSY